MNKSYKLHDETVQDLNAFLTEFAQVKRAVGDHEEAGRAETIRNTINTQS